MRNVYKVLAGESEGKKPPVRSILDGNVILEWTLLKYGGKEWTGFIWLRIRTSGAVL
jgi:hypothetical protein